MMAESKTSALATTMSYVSFEIMLADRPVLGFTRQITRQTLKDRFQETQTIGMEISDDMRKVFLRFFVKVGYSNTSGEDGIIRVFCSQIRGCFCSEVL